MQENHIHCGALILVLHVTCEAVSCGTLRMKIFEVWVGDSDTYNGTRNQKCYTAPFAVYPGVMFTCLATGRYFFVHQPNIGSQGEPGPIINFAEIQIWGFPVGVSSCSACDACTPCDTGMYSTASCGEAASACAVDGGS